MRLLLITLLTVSGCAAVDINKPGMRVTGVVPGSEARRMAQTEIVGEAGERGDCANAYTADGTLVTSSADGVTVNCGGWYGSGGGYAGSGHDAQQAQLDNPDFGAPARPRAEQGTESEVSAQEAANKKKAAEAFKKKKAIADQDAAALAEDGKQ